MSTMRTGAADVATAATTQHVIAPTANITVRGDLVDRVGWTRSTRPGVTLSKKAFRPPFVATTRQVAPSANFSVATWSPVGVSSTDVTWAPSPIPFVSKESLHFQLAAADEQDPSGLVAAAGSRNAGALENRRPALERRQQAPPKGNHIPGKPPLVPTLAAHTQDTKSVPSLNPRLVSLQTSKRAVVKPRGAPVQQIANRKCGFGNSFTPDLDHREGQVRLNRRAGSPPASAHPGS